MDKDYSNYQMTAYDRYRLYRSNRKNVRLDYFFNRASFFPDDRHFVISVDSSNEYDSMRDYLDAYDEDFAARQGKKVEDLNREEEIETEEEKAQAVSERRTRLAELQKRYHISNSPYLDLGGRISEALHDQIINVLSGAVVRMNYGEGILDFIYADFATPLREAVRMVDFMESLVEAMKEQRPQAEPEAMKLIAERKPEQILNETQEIVNDFMAYSSTFRAVQDVAYASLYSAAFPPLFEEDPYRGREKLEWYGNYLLTLQEEYRELLEFCYDEDFYPEVLGKLYPSERLYLFRRSKGLPVSYLRTEEFLLSKNRMGGNKMPFGLKSEELGPMLNRVLDKLSDAEMEFAEKYHISGAKVNLRTNTFMSVGYEVRSIASMLELEFTKMLEQDIRFRKCKRCGKYFIMKGNYDTNYCDRIAAGQTRTCQELAAIDNYRAKVADNEALAIYSKYYKRYSARLKVHQIKEEDFKKWRYQALTKRDECTGGKITPQELTDWMEAAFPNRKPRKQKEE